jgi:hypothetical protein
LIDWNTLIYPFALEEKKALLTDVDLSGNNLLFYAFKRGRASGETVIQLLQMVFEHNLLLKITLPLAILELSQNFLMSKFSTTRRKSRAKQSLMLVS